MICWFSLILSIALLCEKESQEVEQSRAKLEQFAVDNFDHSHLDSRAKSIIENMSDTQVVMLASYSPDKIFIHLLKKLRIDRESIVYHLIIILDADGGLNPTCILL